MKLIVHYEPQNREHQSRGIDHGSQAMNEPPYESNNDYDNMAQQFSDQQQVYVNESDNDNQGNYDDHFNDNAQCSRPMLDNVPF